MQQTAWHSQSYHKRPITKPIAPAIETNQMSERQNKKVARSIAKRGFGAG
jgi:hypothetical protein